jgi:hypothetical protein
MLAHIPTRFSSNYRLNRSVTHSVTASPPSLYGVVRGVPAEITEMLNIPSLLITHYFTLLPTKTDVTRWSESEIILTGRV